MNTKYFSELVLYYNNLKEENNKKRFLLSSETFPKSIMNIYSPENDCMKPIGEGYSLTKYNVTPFDMIEFFIHQINTNNLNDINEYTKFFNFITKCYEKSIISSNILLNDLLRENNKIYELFMYSFFEKMPENMLNNKIIQKILNIVPTNTFFLKYINEKGFEFDEKTLKLMKKYS